MTIIFSLSSGRAMRATLVQAHQIIFLASLLLVDAAAAGVVASSGHLASRTDAPGWQVLQTGDEVPQKTELRTSSAGAVTVSVEGASVVVDGDSQLSLDQNGRHLRLDSGRVHIAATDRWELRVGPFRVRAEPQAAVTISERQPLLNFVLA